MASAKTQRAEGKIDRLMDSASRALEETKYHQCQRICLEALELAHTAGDYERMARIVLPLQEARRQLRLAAIDTKKLVILEEQIPETEKIVSACYLLQPPLVGADGRDLRERAEHEETPVFVLVREPENRMGLWPIVMIGPVTVRTRVEPPKNQSKPDLAWFIRAHEALGDAAIAQAGDNLNSMQRVDELYDRIGTVSDHEKIHQALEQACREAMEESSLEETKPHTTRRRRVRKSRLNLSDEEE